MAHKVQIHGRDHCPDGSDPIPCLVTDIPSGITASVLFATRTSFAPGSANIQWGDVNTNDTSVFQMSSGSNPPNDRILLKKMGFYLVLTSVGLTDAADAGTDWAVTTLVTGGTPAATIISPAIATNLIDWDLGQASTEIRMILQTSTTGWIESNVAEVRSGTLDAAFASQQIMYLTATSNTMTDIV